MLEVVGFDIVKGSAPSTTEKETAGRAGDGNVEAPAPSHIERKKKRENNNVEEIDRNVLVCRSGRAHIRKERR
jgi:hypothetical protein